MENVFVEFAKYLIEQIVQGMQSHKQQFRSAFDEILKPAHAKLGKVHENYIQMFQETLRLLPNGTPEDDSTEYIHGLRNAEMYLQDKRKELDTIRVSLRALAKVTSMESSEPEVKDYGNALLDYFYQWPENLMGGSATAGILAHLEEAIRQGNVSAEYLRNTRDTIQSYINGLIEQKRVMFALVAEAFVRLEWRAAQYKSLMPG